MVVEVATVFECGDLVQWIDQPLYIGIIVKLTDLQLDIIWLLVDPRRALDVPPFKVSFPGDPAWIYRKIRKL